MPFIIIISFLSTIDGGYLDNAIQLLFVEKDIHIAEIGISISILFILTMFLQLLIQKAVRKYGYKVFFLTAIITFIISLLTVIFTDNNLVALICNIIQGIAIWLEWTLLQSYVVDLNNDASNYGKLQFTTNIGNGIGAILFLIIMILDIPFKYQISISITIFAYVVLFVIFLFRKNVKPKINIDYNKDEEIGYKTILKEKVPKLYACYYLILCIQYGLFSTLTGILIAVSLGLGDIYLSIYSCIGYLIGAIVTNLAIKKGVSKKFEDIILVILNLIFVVALFGNPFVIIILLLFNRFITNVFAISLETKVHSIYSDGRSSLLMGIQAAAEYIGYAIGALFAGILLSYNYRYLVALALVFTLLTTFLIYILRKEMREKGCYKKYNKSIDLVENNV